MGDSIVYSRSCGSVHEQTQLDSIGSTWQKSGQGKRPLCAPGLSNHSPVLCRYPITPFLVFHTKEMWTRSWSLVSTLYPDTQPYARLQAWDILKNRIPAITRARRDTHSDCSLFTPTTLASTFYILPLTFAVGEFEASLNDELNDPLAKEVLRNEWTKRTLHL